MSAVAFQHMPRRNRLTSMLASASIFRQGRSLCTLYPSRYKMIFLSLVAVVRQFLMKSSTQELQMSLVTYALGDELQSQSRKFSAI